MLALLSLILGVVAITLLAIHESMEQEKKKETLSIDDILVARTKIVTDFLKQEDAHKCFKQIYLVRKIGGKYYEVFSGHELQKSNGFTMNLEIPYIENIEPEPLKSFIKGSSMELSKEKLFEFVTWMNCYEEN